MSLKSLNVLGLIRFCIGVLMSIGITTFILWSLIPVYDPEATLITFNLSGDVGDSRDVFIEIELINRNRHRGFNYSFDGWVELFYVPKSGPAKELNYDYNNNNEYQKFKQPLVVNHTMGVSLDSTITESLKSQDTYIYVSLFLTYRFHFMFWKIETPYYQWLDAKAYLNDNLQLKEVTPFHRMQDFNLAISS